MLFATYGFLLTFESASLDTLFFFFFFFLFLVSGYVQSPGYNPESMVSCATILYATATLKPPAHHAVMISFLHMDIGYNTVCKDLMHIYQLQVH